MSIINNGLLLAAGAAATPVSSGGDRSLRFNSADSTNLSWTPASAGNRQIFTISVWCKLANFSSGLSKNIISADDANTYFGFGSSNSFFYDTTPDGGGDRLIRSTAAVFRDSSAWYHVVIAVNTTLATDTQRIRLYINNVEYAFSVLSFGSGYVAQNSNLSFNNGTNHLIGRRHGSGPGYFDGYLADMRFIDGQALTPSSFAETNATTGQWVPKAYTGSYGTNGFRLTFSDNSGTTATTLGKDAAGSNNWTPNGFSVAAGSGNDSLVDHPVSSGTDTGAGGEVRGNYCTLNPLASTVTPTNGNLQVDLQSTANTARGSIGITSGSFYFEVTSTTSGTGQFIGIATNSFGATSGNYWGYHQNGYIYYNGGYVGPYSSLGNGDVIGIAVNATNGSIAFYKNGSLIYTFNGLSELVYYPYLAGTNGTTTTVVANFGQRPFAYTAPSGFKALCDTNLPAPVVAKGSSAFDVKLYTGNGSTQTISGLGFSPDLVWIKNRAATYGHIITDSVRGNTKQLYPYATNAESTETTALTAFNSDGFSLGSWAPVNVASNAHVAWCWDAGTTTTTNTAGSITSSVRANTSAGFSIVTYTGTGSNATIGHGLGAAPELIIVKQRTGPTPRNWVVYHKAIGSDKYLVLSTTDAQASLSTVWNNTSPTSSVFSVGTSTGTNESASVTYVAYCFAPVAGYSSFGSYTGNGSADGPFVYTGFRPRWVMIKATGGSTGNENWMIKDALRPAYNPTDGNLYANQSFAEDSTSTVFIDLVSNGFKIRGTYAGVNTNAVSYIYAAFAENPFQYARAR